MPGGARDVLSKLNAPKRYACAESFGFNLAERTRFKESSAYGRSLSHSAHGYFGSQVARHAKKWFLKDRIARSAAFRRCMCGGPSSKSILFFINAFRKSAENSLSNMYLIGCSPRCFNFVFFSLRLWCSQRPVLFLVVQAILRWSHNGTPEGCIHYLCWNATGNGLLGKYMLFVLARMFRSRRLRYAFSDSCLDFE